MTLDRVLFALLIVASLVVLGILSIPLATGEVYVHGDFGETHLPMRAFYSRCLAEGHSFDWYPNFHSGFYLHGEGQAGMYHPMHLALYRALPLERAFVLEIVASYPFLLIGTFLFLRRWRLGRSACLFGAFLFAFSGFNLLHIRHINAVAVVSHIPWLLLAIDVAFRSTRPAARRLAGVAIALLTASQCLLGYPQYVYLSGLAEAAYALLLLVRLRRGRPLFGLVTGKALGVLTGAIQILPTLETVGRSTRSDPDAGFNYFFSLHPANLVQPIAPYFYDRGVFEGYAHEMGLYQGAIPVALCAWLWMRRRDLAGLRSLVVAFALLGALGLVLALGSHGYLYRLWVRLPGLGLFRCPCRHIVLVHLSMSVLSAVALDDLLRRRVDAPGDLPSTRTWPLLALPILALAVAALALHPRFVPHVWTTGRILLGPALVLAATALVLASARGFRLALVGVVLLGTVDLAAYGLDHLWRHRPFVRIEDFVDGRPRPPGETSHRVSGASNRTAIAGVRRIGGYVGLPPRERLGVGSPATLRLAEVGWVVAPDGRSFVRVPDPLPRVRLVTEAIASSDLARDLDTIDVARTALVDEALDLDGGRPGVVALVRDEPGLVEATVDEVAGRSLLVLSESYHPGWRARIDGSSRPVIAAYGDYIGVVVGSGDREVVLEFDPDSLRIGRRLTLLGLLLLTAMALASRWPGGRALGS